MMLTASPLLSSPVLPSLVQFPHCLLGLPFLKGKSDEVSSFQGLPTEPKLKFKLVSMSQEALHTLAYVSLQHHLLHSPQEAWVSATPIITSQLMLLPLSRTLFSDLLSPALCLSRLSLEISTCKKLSLALQVQIKCSYHEIPWNPILLHHIDL